MNLRIRFLALPAAAALALAIAGCGASGSEIGSAPGQTEHTAHTEHADHPAPVEAEAGANAGNAESADAADATDTKPEPSDVPAYTLEAEVEQRGDGYYLIVGTNLKLSKDNYGRSPVEGEGHIHLFINGSLIGPITDFEPVPLRNLKEGENVVRVELAQNNHSVIAGTGRTVRFEYAPPESEQPEDEQPDSA